MPLFIGVLGFKNLGLVRFANNIADLCFVKH